MNQRRPIRGPWDRGGGGGGFGGGGNPFGSFFGPTPIDLIALLVFVFVTFSFQFFSFTRVVPDLLHLSSDVWRHGFLWQTVTYPFAGYGGPSIWFLLELLILYWFGRDVFSRLGRKRFWSLLGTAAFCGALLAVPIDALLPDPAVNAPFVILQGQRTLIAILIAAFATLNRNATILLFFVLPVRASWFLWLEILFAFMAFLATKDLAGFVGLSTAVWATWATLTFGDPATFLRRTWLRLEQRRVERELERLQRQRREKLKVLRGGKDGDDGDGNDDDDGNGEVRPGPWVN